MELSMEKNIMIKNELIYEGEYLNEKRWNGKGREYVSNGDFSLSLFGEYLDGKMTNTIGDEYHNDITFLSHFFYHLNIHLHISLSNYLHIAFLYHF